MKIPLVWLQDYLDTSKSAQKLAESFTAIGLMLDKPVGEDQVLDLEQRLNRSDLLSVLGCARDLAAFENLKLKEPKIKRHNPLAPTKECRVKIVVDTPAVRRFNTRIFRGIKVGPSPQWLKERLELYGIESINNIVDITNFVMVELGQPMHAQDTDKLQAPEITIRETKSEEKLTTLLGTEVTLYPPAFVLSSGGRTEVIGGIVGGANSGVGEGTTNILLDAGNYDPRIVHTASRRLKITNETVIRYDKPLDPRLTEVALNRATDLILQLAGGKYYANVDYYPNPVTPQSLTLTLSRLQLISGLPLTLKDAQNILIKLGFVVTEQSKKQLTVEVPYWRTDLEVEDDLISDILRMSDYNRLPASALTTPIPPDITPPIYGFEDVLRDKMVALGAHEHITSQLLENDSNPQRVPLENALSSDASALRLSALETLPAVATTYRKHGINSPILFEIGISFYGKKYQEIRELAVLTPLSDCRVVLATLLHSLGISHRVDSDLSILVGSTPIGSIKSLHSFTLDPLTLLPHYQPYTGVASQFTHFSTLDLSLRLPKGIVFANVEKIIRGNAPLLRSLEVPDEHDGWILARLTFAKHVKDSDAVRVKVLARLVEKGVATRSGQP